VELGELVGFINRRHRTSFSITGKLQGGTGGAYGLVDSDGRRAVLKRAVRPQRDDQLARTVRVVDALRRVGYPAPAYLHVGRAPGGTSYYVQQFLEGTPVADVTAELLDQILALNALQADRDARQLAGEQDWSRHVHGAVFGGESGRARTMRAMRTHSDDTTALLDAVLALTRPLAGVTLPTDDIVHGDFGPDNVLARDGRVTGVIDLEAAGCGSRAIDLAVLLRWGWEGAAPAERAKLAERIAPIAGPAGAAICIACQVIDILAFAIEHQAPGAPRRRMQKAWEMLHLAELAMDSG
jgi:aminoglycoside phosphotransferase (APT) family kinase protein